MSSEKMVLSAICYLTRAGDKTKSCSDPGFQQKHNHMPVDLLVVHLVCQQDIQGHHVTLPNPIQNGSDNILDVT